MSMRNIASTLVFMFFHTKFIKSSLHILEISGTSPSVIKSIIPLGVLGLIKLEIEYKFETTYVWSVSFLNTVKLIDNGLTFCDIWNFNPVSVG